MGKAPVIARQNEPGVAVVAAPVLAVIMSHLQNDAQYACVLCDVQGLQTPEVARKMSMLVDEGVRFEGVRVKPTSVVGPAELACICRGV